MSKVCFIENKLYQKKAPYCTINHSFFERHRLVFLKKSTNILNIGKQLLDPLPEFIKTSILNEQNVSEKFIISFQKEHSKVKFVE